jgi:hypothetical protein
MSPLERKRTLNQLNKRELVDWIIQLETSLNNTRYTLNAFRARVDPHGDEMVDHGGFEDH